MISGYNVLTFSNKKRGNWVDSNVGVKSQIHSKLYLTGTYNAF